MLNNYQLISSRKVLLETLNQSVATCFFAEYSDINNETTETETFVHQEDKKNE